MFQIIEVYFMLRKVQARWVFLHVLNRLSLVKQSRVYIVIVITDVKDQILNNITWFPLLQLKTYPT